MSNNSNDENNNNKENELMLFYVKDVGYQIFTHIGDVLSKYVTEEKPLSPYVASLMITNVVINFVNEFVSYEKDEKHRNNMKKEMFNIIMKLVFYENNKEFAQAIQDNPGEALNMLKEKYANMQIEQQPQEETIIQT